MNRYIERINTFVETIRKNEYLEIVDYRINPPINKDIFYEIEDHFEFSFDDTIKLFYSQLNGFYLHWRINATLTEDEVETLRNKYDDYWIEFPEDSGNTFAKVNILPLEDTFLTRDWVETYQWNVFDEASTIEFRNKTYSKREFANYIKPFDLFSEFSCMAYYINQAEQLLDVILLSGHYAEWDNTRVTDFGTYIESVFRYFGIVEARDSLYSEYRGDRLPRVTVDYVDWDEIEPQLFQDD